MIPYNNNKLVSIVIPAYNCENFIKETIFSVLSQSYQNFEIRIVDDGSNDNTSEVVKSIHDSRIFYHHQDNSSQAVARNNGISYSKGSFIAFLDHDDLWHPDKLSMQLPLLNNNNIGLVYSRIIIIDESGNLKDGNEHYECYRGDKLFDNLLFFNFIPVSSVIVKASILRNNNLYFKTGRQGAEDWDLWLRLSKLTHFDFSSEPLVKYRIHSASMGNRNIDLMYKSAIATLDEIREQFDPGNKVITFNHAYQIIMLRYGHQLISNNRIPESRKIFFDLLKRNHFNIRPLWGIIKSYLK